MFVSRIGVRVLEINWLLTQLILVMLSKATACVPLREASSPKFICRKDCCSFLGGMVALLGLDPSPMAQDDENKGGLPRIFVKS